MNARIFELELEHGSGAYRPAPLALVRGEGPYVWDAEGKRYLDFNTGVGVALLGHAHPALTRALSDQAGRLMTCAAGYFPNDVRAQFLQKLVDVLPEGLERVFLSNSGAEAVETALKLARACTGRPKVVAATRGFHGRTLGALSATWKPDYRKPFGPLVPGFEHVPFGDLDALKSAVDGRTAAVILEPVQGEGGVHPAPSGYLRGAGALCAAHGALLILDEVQTGLRTGAWLYSEREGVVPDVVCFGKGLGGGVPIGATVFRSSLSFRRGQHGSTFGGNPLACRAALAVLETVERDGLLERSRELGAYFLKELQGLVEEFPDKVREARGVGLMLGVQLRFKAAPVLDALRRRGVLALSAGPTVVRFLPPLVIERAHVDRAVEVLHEVLQESPAPEGAG